MQKDAAQVAITPMPLDASDVIYKILGVFEQHCFEAKVASGRTDNERPKISKHHFEMPHTIPSSTSRCDMPRRST
jgi:hypothetical protein